MNNRFLFFAIIIIAPFIFVSFSSIRQNSFDLKASVGRGKEVYVAYCVSCHRDQGEGVEALYPPLAKSDYLMADKKRSIWQLLYGVSGEMKVNGKLYNTEMTGFELNDDEASDVLNYIRNFFGNEGNAVKLEDVKAERK